RSTHRELDSFLHVARHRTCVLLQLRSPQEHTTRVRKLTAMPSRRHRRAKARIASIVRVAISLLVLGSFPHSPNPCGNNAQRLLLNKAVDTLPYEIRAFFDSNRADLLRHVTDPFDAIAKNQFERRNHYLALEKYGRFPFDQLPRDYKAALQK